uniref:Zn(2)-C6 fungal-type domain-containing protein n=1 Tax=Ganoderma boninense TaxID=34458 RepID=A0A5K1JSI2_9APHY|nr:Zn(2)-C6 fungal-type domain-containing protein [Ganoderma boninense]
MPPSTHPSGSLQTFIAGAIDPATGVFERTDNVVQQRLRTAHACEHCRIRKSKCNGKNPCGRCRARGLLCEYSAERPRTRPFKRRQHIVASSATRTTCTGPSNTPGHPLPESSIPAASSDSSSGAASESDVQRSAGTPSTHPRAPYAYVEASSTGSSPTPALHAHAAPEMPRPHPRVAIAGESPPGPSCDVSDPESSSSSGARAGFARRRPPPRPLDPMRNRGRARVFPFQVPVPIETDRHQQHQHQHPALFWAHSHSYGPHSSDRIRAQGPSSILASLYSPYLPPRVSESESGSRSRPTSRRVSKEDVSNRLHPSPVVTAHSSNRRTTEDAPQRSIPNPVSLSSSFGRHVVVPWPDLVDSSRRAAAPPTSRRL